MAAWYTGSKEEWSLESSVLSCYLPVHSERRCRHPPGERQATPLSPEKRWLIWPVWLCSQRKIQGFLQEGVGNCGGLQRKLWKISFLLNLCLAPRPAQMWIRWALPPQGLGVATSPAIVLVVWLCGKADTQQSAWEIAVIHVASDFTKWEKEGSAGDGTHSQH